METTKTETTKEELLKAFLEEMKRNKIDDYSKKEGSVYFDIMNKNPEEVYTKHFTRNFFDGSITLKLF